ncbi:fibronectin type III domain-containing protein [Dyadobacter diqingensis]|uniref:fibronectin type III domain-containing protein n=1 Tax=Dyadobacter diqingensis TaxID=2938121 RepID=UPI0020C19A33|nr:fibronectin type III domain-containing protein [Dyadobacter diqingensis]
MRSFILLLCLLTALFKTNLAEAYSRTAEHKPGFTKDENLPAALRDGRHFFIREHALAGQPSQAEIDAAMAASVAQGRIIQVTTGGLNIPSLLKEITSLPVVFRSRISGHDYDIVIMGMRFTPTGATLSMGCRFTLPGNALPGNALPDSQTNLYFGSNDIAVSGKSGFAGDLPILKTSLGDAKSSELDDPGKLLGGQTSFAEFALPGFGSNLTMGLGADSKLSFTCGAFNTFSLSGFVKAYNLVEKETADGKKVADGKPLLLVFTGQQTSDWKDIFIDAKVASAFHAASYPDLGFHFGSDNLAKIDLSMLRNPANLPSCAQVSAESWQGIAFPTFKLRLPAFFKLRSAATLAMGNVAPATGKNLFMDAKGLLGSVGAENVYTLKEGYTDEINKYDMSLDNLTANYSCNGQVTASMLGKIAMPWCGENSKSDAPLLRYSFRYTNNRYEVFVKDTEQGNYGSGPYLLSTGSQLAFNVTDSKFLIQTKSTEKPVISADVYGNSVCRDFPAKLSASQCTDKALIWSTGASGASLEVKPAVTTTYTVKCRDKYCVSASSDSLKITVYESLPKPALIAGRDAFCRYESTDLSADNCVGKIEWKNPGDGSFDGSGADQRVQHASFSNVNQATDFTYLVRCNLNSCLSPEAAKTLRVNPEPAAPNLYSNAPNNTIDKNGSVTIGGNCANGDRLVWENLPPGGVPQSTVTLASTTSYAAICWNDATGCQSLSKSSITINVLYFPPAAPTNLAFSGAGTNFLTLTWQDNSGNEDGFTILRSTSPTFANAQTVGNVGANITSFHDNNLTEGITYYYQVISHNRYDNGYSDWASRSTVITPGAPELRADNQNIVKGTAARVSGYCPVGNLVWTVPVGYGGGERVQYENTTYWAKCVNEGVEGRGGSITVSVYVPTPGAPELSASSTNIVKGGKVNVTGTCASGTLVWTVPVGYGGGERTQNETTTYWAKCVNDGVESGGSSITVSVYVPTPGAPQLSASNTSIVKGSKANVFGTCPSGTLVWTAPVGFGGGEWLQQDNVTYWAKCVNEGFESAGVSITVAVYVPTPNLPQLSATSTSIEKGSPANVHGTCGSGTLVWTAPVGYGGGERVQYENTTYWAKCVNERVESAGASITVSVYDKPVVPCNLPSVPWISVDDITITSGTWGRLTANGCDGGSIQWNTGSTDRSIGVNQGGYYTATCTVRNDCGSSTGSDGGTVNVQNAPCNPPSTPWISVDDITITSGTWGTLTANGCDGGSIQWNTGSTDRSIGVNQGGYYTATCTVRNDCGSSTGSDGGTVNVQNAPCNPPSTPWISVDDITITSGTWGTLTANGCDGGSIQWNTGSTDRSIGVNQGGYYTATCTVRNDCGSSTGSDGGTVNVQNAPCNPPSTPWISVDDITITSGTWGTLTANGCDGGSIQWNTGSTDRSIGVNQGGYYTATCTVRNDCGSSTGSDGGTVNVQNAPCNPPSTPWISVDDITITSGTWGTLTANGCDGGSIQWNTGSTDRSIGVNQGGYYTATCTVRNDCGSSTGSDGGTVNVQNAPCNPPSTPWISVDDITITSGTWGTLTANGCDGGSIQWNTGSTDRSIGVNQGGYYTATCTVRNDCGSSTGSDGGAVNVQNAPCNPPSTPWISVDDITITSGTWGTLTANGCDGGSIQWNTGSTDRSIGVNQGGYYTATCTVRNDCGSSTGSDGGTVNVQNVPCNLPSTPWISVDDITITSGTWGTLTANGCDGGSIQWNTGSTDRGIGVNQEGYYTATCTVSNACGSSSNSDGGTVHIKICNPPSTPWIAVEDITIDYLAWGTLVAQGCEGGSVQWSNGSTERSIRVNKAGIFTATCAVTNECGTSQNSDQASVRLTLPCFVSRPVFNINGNSNYQDNVTINQGESIQVGASCLLGQLSWSAGSPGNYRPDNNMTFVANCSQSTCSNSSTFTVNVIKCTPPSAPSLSGPTSVIKGFSATLTASGCPQGSVYNWSPSGDVSNIGSASQNVVNILSETHVSVSCTYNGCSGPQAAINITPRERTPGPGEEGGNSGCKSHFIKPNGNENSEWMVSYISCEGKQEIIRNTWGDDNPGFYVSAQDGKISCSGSNGGGCKID